ncbi:MAG TPA: CHRD domain-containing protein [Bryobacteraceae bacterium]|nr:CHRD domain-containing protein [Bryobacteraceae bacterium]
MIRTFTALRFAAVLLVAAALLAQTGQTYKARLSAVPADARTRAALAGIGSATATLSGEKLTVSGSFEGLLSPATTAQLHAGELAGVRGPVIQDLTISKATSGTISGSAELTADQIQKLHKGGLYIQIQSEKEPEGVLWGWLLR